MMWQSTEEPGRPAVVRRTTCRMCDSTDLVEILRLEPTPPGDHYVTAENLAKPQPVYPMMVVMCSRCGLAQLSEVVDPEILYRDYIYNTSVSLGLIKHFDDYAADVIDRTGLPQHSLVVDVGSNDGTLLGAFKTRGMRVFGVDPARDIAQKATAAGLETIDDFFSPSLARDVRRDHGAAALITANNVFANVDDLHGFVEGVLTLLAPDGTFVFETGYFPDLVRRRIIDNIYQEHLSYYSVKPLQQFFARRGMELVAVEHAPTKGGSIRGFVQPAGSARRLAPAMLRQLVEQETAGGFDRPERLQDFRVAIESLRAELTRLVHELRMQSRTIAGYGASVGVTTLIHHFGLGASISFLVDDNPVRYGRFTPGHHIPVLPSSALYERRPDYVLLLAWRYADPIMNRHEAYRRDGGRFILPLPEIAIR